jgi:FdhD protein
MKRAGKSPQEGARRCQVLTYRGATAERRDDAVATEEPLEIQLSYERNGYRVKKNVAITMRTPGHDEELAVGFLWGEQVIRSAGDWRRVEQRADHVVRVELNEGVEVDWDRLERNFYTTSSCGVCGKTSLQALTAGPRRRKAAWSPLFSPELIHRLPEILRETQTVFGVTGGLHAAALFEAEGRLVRRREDVGRHNAVDKLIGASVLAGEMESLAEQLLLVSGRASFELMQKALVAGIPILAAVGAPSSLAVELAQQEGATLLGFVRDGRFNVYAGSQRIAGPGLDRSPVRRRSGPVLRGK